MATEFKEPRIELSGFTNGHQQVARHDFSRIRTSVRIPNLIEVQRESYNRFLQMDLLPAERDNIGLQAVFRSTFPISDFRDTSSLEFVEFRIGNWQCKCGQLQGLHHLRSNCKQCGASSRTRHIDERRVWSPPSPV